MSLSIWKKFSLPELTPTRMTLELPDRSITRPKVVAEDVFVKVGKFHFPTDFVVVDFEANPRVPLILRRSFLRTGRALIDVYLNEIPRKLRIKSILTVKEVPHIQPPVVPISIPEPDVSRTQQKPTIPYPSRLNDQKLCEKATNQMEKFFQIFHDLHFDISFADALLLMPKFALTIKSLLTNKDKLFEEGIVLGHKISKSGIEVDRAKVDVIAKLPHPTTVKGSENLAADHLSRLENPHKDVLENKDINENFPLETLGSLSSDSTLWFADITNFRAGNFIKKGLTSQQKKKFFKDVKHYFWDDPYLF
nr:reverse transcriptase domain-containing protein [Tanacetum cinerariifolium]